MAKHSLEILEIYHEMLTKETDWASWINAFDKLYFLSCQKSYTKVLFCEL